jgi:hypothetical protein
MINIYADILVIYCDIILSCCAIREWVLPAGFFTQTGVGMGQNIYPSAGVGAGADKILRHG